MRFNPFSAIRYAVAVYGLALEYLYPFTSLPFAISISDELQESLKFQSQIASYLSAVASLSFLVMFFYFMVFFTTLHGVIGIGIRYLPAFREKVEKRIAEKAKKAQNNNKKKPSKRAVWASITFNIFFSVAMIINDAIFNRSEDAASLKDGAIERFYYMGLYLVIFGCMLLFAWARALYRARRQQRAVADEESRLPPSEMAEVEVEGEKRAFVLEEKLIDFSDGMDGLYEKMEAYAAPTPATEPVEEEPLIRL
ncbi:hypothetical protein BT96DRAFT_918356 [Gymnopus androsaceus JB14]|uniref:Uncharacterized protein n=1 Tax=Gymnopus androsaceus JB14 TaxID=1447944 RepID=A0A6A4HUM5_9AGAR|nr:hypothetical protein BT96DRAFT_918356 [Gymnopus androsaceus JB14]